MPVKNPAISYWWNHIKYDMRCRRKFKYKITIDRIHFSIRPDKMPRRGLAILKNKVLNRVASYFMSLTSLLNTPKWSSVTLINRRIIGSYWSKCCFGGHLTSRINQNTQLLQLNPLDFVVLVGSDLTAQYNVKLEDTWAQLEGTRRRASGLEVS